MEFSILKACYKDHRQQFADHGKIVGNRGGAESVTHDAAFRSWLPSLEVHDLARLTVGLSPSKATP